MRSGLTMDVDFYALGCVMFFMLTSQLMISKENRENRLTPRDIESKMKHSGLSKEATDLVLLLTSKQKFESSKRNSYSLNFKCNHLEFRNQDGSLLHEEDHSRSSKLFFEFCFQ